jgi:hypothetical protein
MPRVEVASVAWTKRTDARRAARLASLLFQATPAAIRHPATTDAAPLPVEASASESSGAVGVQKREKG